MIIEQGQIWEVITDNFFTSGRHHKVSRPVQLTKGEKIEIRFPYEWHFRTVDNQYFNATSEMILGNCKLFGTILEPVRFMNRASLEEILRLRLYSN